MIPARYAHIAFGFFLSGMMTFIVSGISTFVALGLVDGFVALWMKAWLPSFCVSFPIVLVVAPIARRMVAAVTKPENA